MALITLESSAMRLKRAKPGPVRSCTNLLELMHSTVPLKMGMAAYWNTMCTSISCVCVKHSIACRAAAPPAHARVLESLPPAQAHEPADGRKIDEDLEDSVLAANDAANAEPKPKIGGIQVYNRPSSIRKKMLLAV